MTTMLDTTTAELDATVAGPVLEPGDPGYAEEVASFSLTFTAAPAVVVGATSAADVAAAVRYAARTGRRVAVQSTGHGLQSDLAGTVLVSTRRMDAVTVDPESATARVQAGARWRQVIDARRAVRAGPAQRLVVAGRGRRLHPRRRPRPDGAPLRVRRRPRPPVHPRHRRRRDPRRHRRERPRPVLGGPRRQVHLRHRDRPGVRADARRPLLRRVRRLPGRGHRGGPARLARVGADAVRRHDDVGRDAAAAPGPGAARAAARPVRHHAAVRPPRFRGQRARRCSRRCAHWPPR